MTLFDSHAHYCDERFDLDRDSLLASLPEGGVVGVINVPSDLEEAESCIELAQKWPFMWAAAGVHPQLADKWEEGSGDRLRALLTAPKCVALGEIGLDYVVGDVARDIQKRVFAAQLEIARETGRPVIIHDREAHGDTMDMLRSSGCRGVVHCFSGSAEMAAELVREGWYISFTGVVTFKNARRALEAARATPIERIMIETDAPYLAPEPFRGKRNDSRLTAYTCAAVASAIGVSPDILAKATAENARRCFSL